MSVNIILLGPPGGGKGLGVSVFFCVLEQVFKEYVENMGREDGGDYAEDFAKWLRKYADKVEAAGVRARRNQHMFDCRRHRAKRRKNLMRGL